jgi:hypothetical protein
MLIVPILRNQGTILTDAGTAMSGIVGTVVGYYFGSEKSATTTTTPPTT